MSEKPALQRTYHIPLPMFQEAFRNFQKKYVFPKNIVITVILAVIAGVYIQAAVKDNTQTMAYLLIVVCIAMILILWYRPLKMRRSLAEALKEIESDTYELTLYSEKLTIRTEDAPQPETEQEVPEETSEDQKADAAPETETAPESQGDGFQQLFDEKPAGAAEPIPATEIYFDGNVKFLEYTEFFMVYLVKQNFYVIPKKDFSEDEISKLRAAFKL